jgi:hypothetical protein
VGSLLLLLLPRSLPPFSLSLDLRLAASPTLLFPPLFSLLPPPTPSLRKVYEQGDQRMVNMMERQNWRPVSDKISVVDEHFIALFIAHFLLQHLHHKSMYEYLFFETLRLAIIAKTSISNDTPIKTSTS